MSALTENVVLSRTRSQDLRAVKRLNCWGSDLKDVSIVQRLPNVEVLSLSINNITTLGDFATCRSLQELYLRQNKIQDINEILYLVDLPDLKKLWLAENPCADFDNYRSTVLKALPNLEMLDNTRVTPDDLIKAEREGYDLQWPGVSDVEEEDNEEVNQQILPQESQMVAPQAMPMSAPIAQTYQMTPQPPIQPMQEIIMTNTNGNGTAYHQPMHMPLTHQNSSPNISPIETTPQLQKRSQTMIKSNSLSDYNLYNGSAIQAVLGPIDHYEQHNNNNNNNMNSQSRNNTIGRISSAPNGSAPRLLPKGGKHRNANILSAVLCLIKELDYASLEVVDTTIHCRMEEMED
ncbi:uncharacterized protein LOC128959437 [Oppia nitens]|uniref:uncharacterized protein LOC128959437 n=1 Tax=Oppia nitens TaxID=1686743 RepID=UPI0023DBA45B|nr:uncharacterized protein LOC128959437 [Oppia nitens]